MTHRLRICGLALAATLTASGLSANNTFIQASFFDTSGLVAISVNHSANLCVTNLGNKTVRTLLAYSTPAPASVSERLARNSRPPWDPTPSGTATLSALWSPMVISRVRQMRMASSYKEELWSRAEASATPAGAMTTESS